MRILHIYKDYFPVVGGIENHVKLLAEAQAMSGHDVSVLVTSRDHRTHIDQIKSVRVIFAARLATISSAPVSFALPRMLAHEEPDIAHLHFPYPWGELANYFFGRARRTVVTYHSDIIRQKYLRAVYGLMIYRVLKRVDRILATSPNYMATSPVLRKFADKCTVVPLGVDVARFQNPPSTPKGKEVRLLFVGHLRYYKGLDYLLRAMSELPGVRLTIVGTGPMDGQLRALAKKLRIEDRVAFEGQVSEAELPAHFAACDIFVLPASERSEAFGVVQLEAMAAGKPVICTEIGTGTSYVNVDGETGFVVPARDPHALAAAITKLIQDPGRRERMGAAGRARVSREFTLEKMVERVMKVYGQVQDGKG